MGNQAAISPRAAMTRKTRKPMMEYDRVGGEREEGGGGRGGGGGGGWKGNGGMGRKEAYNIMAACRRNYGNKACRYQAAVVTQLWQGKGIRGASSQSWAVRSLYLTK